MAVRLAAFAPGDHDPYRGMPHLELTEDEKLALVALLTRTVADDRYPLSPRVRTLRSILTKLRPGAGS
jgi:hypothetical protein